MPDRNDKQKGFSTRATHLANLPGQSSVPIYIAATHGTDYTRESNPTLDVLANAMMELEGGAGAIVSATGMAAITQTLMTLLSAGSRIVRHRTIYPSTVALMEKFLDRFGVTTVSVDFHDLDALDEALAGVAAVVYGETISNPNMEVVDLAAIAERAHAAGATFVVDNTFATPYFCQPLAHGADVVIDSGSKYLCGHGDALGGTIVCGDEDLARRIHQLMTFHGGSLSPFNASLIIRGLKTLPVRMDAHAERAGKLAAFLKTHPKVTYIRYPGLADDSEHAMARKYLTGFGGMLGFGVDTDREGTYAFADRLKIAKRAPSLGDVHTLVTITHDWPPLVIAESYCRISVGLEDADDLIADFDQALAGV